VENHRHTLPEHGGNFAGSKLRRMAEKRPITPKH
jgi:hypothetical protein